MSKKKVAIVIRELSKNTGATRNTQEQIRFFKSHGYEIDIFAETFNKEMLVDLGASVYRVTFWPFTGNRGRRLFLSRSEKWIARGNYQLVLGHGDIIEQDVLFLHNCVHRASEEIHGRPLSKKSVLGQIHAKAMQAQRFKYLAANSHLMLDDVRQRFGIPSKKLKVIYPSYRKELFSVERSQELRGEARKRFGYGDGDGDVVFGLITSGNFEKRNVELFLKAAAPLCREHPQLKLLVAGKQDEPGRFERLATELGVGNKVQFMPPIAQPELYFSAVDVFVLPAKWEEFGRVVLEAMGTGLPVVVSNRIGASELLEGEARDYILPLEQQAFLSKMKSLFEDEALRKRLGELNSATALKYSEQPQQEKMLELMVQFEQSVGQSL